MVAMQMEVHITLYCFSAAKILPHQSSGSIRIHFEIFFKWSSRLYEFATKVYFLSYSSVITFVELVHKCRYHCKLHTNESEMDLNHQQLRLRLFHVSKYDINGSRLNYSTMSSNKFTYINMYIICKDKA